MPSLLSTVRDMERLRKIAGVLARHGFGQLLSRTELGTIAGEAKPSERPPGSKSLPPRTSVAERVRLVLTDLGPSFVKLGQILSTRPDLLPEELITELKTLQDQVPPVPFAELKGGIEEALGAPIDEVFESFEETPLASASIGQVHRARLRHKDGTAEVVVKVQRPNIQNTIERDIDILYWIARAIEKQIPEAQIYTPVKLVGEFERAIQGELDFTLEADHAERFSRNFEGRTDVRIPRVYREVSSRRVLVLEYFDGKKVYDAVRAGASAERIAKSALAAFFKMVFEDGFFHADPHPGNVLILGPPDAPVLGLIDLGLVGRLTPHLRDKTIDLMVAVAREDRGAMADALLAIGKPRKRIDRDAFEAEVHVLSDRYLNKALRDIETAKLVRDLVTGATKFGLEIPSDFLMVAKALMTVEGVGKEIYPELDIQAEMRPYFSDLLWVRYSPEKVGQELLRSASKLGGATAHLPERIDEVLDELRRGALSVRVDASMPQVADELGRRIYSGLGVAAMILAGGLALTREKWWIGSAFLVSAAGWSMSHAIVVWWLGRTRPR